MGAGRPRRDVVLDSSVLVNFLRIGRTDLIGRRSPFRFHLPDVVEGEIAPKYPDQQAALAAAIRSRDILRRPIVDPAEIQLFQNLMQSGRLGAGESATLSVAALSSLPAAVEDRAAAKVAASLSPPVSILKTQDVVVEAIRGGRLTVAEADQLLLEWATHHRFRLRLTSFADLFP